MNVAQGVCTLQVGALSLLSRSHKGIQPIRIFRVEKILILRLIKLHLRIGDHRRKQLLIDRTQSRQLGPIFKVGVVSELRYLELTYTQDRMLFAIRTRRLLEGVGILIERQRWNLLLSPRLHVRVVLVHKLLQLMAASLFVSVLKILVPIFGDYWLLNRAR